MLRESVFLNSVWNFLKLPGKLTYHQNSKAEAEKEKQDHCIHPLLCRGKFPGCVKQTCISATPGLWQVGAVLPQPGLLWPCGAWQGAAEPHAGHGDGVQGDGMLRAAQPCSLLGQQEPEKICSCPIRYMCLNRFFLVEILNISVNSMVRPLHANVHVMPYEICKLWCAGLWSDLRVYLKASSMLWFGYWTFLTVCLR